MCTVTIIKLAATAEGGPGYRLKVNRDELRTRPEASPPVWRDVHASGMHGPARRAIYPVDPKGGGTWVAAAPCGLAMAILNMNLTPAPAVPADLISRGAIIPSLVGHTRAEDAVAGLDHMDLERYKPFRLIIMDLERAVGGVDDEMADLRPLEVVWDRRTLQVTEHACWTNEGWGGCWASSGLGDALVQVRLPLWEQMLAEAGEGGAAEAQEQFHIHQWPERTHQSVRMSRPDARTVAMTTVEVRGAGLRGAAGTQDAAADVRMWYEPVREGEPPVVRLDRAAGSRAAR